MDRLSAERGSGPQQQSDTLENGAPFAVGEGLTALAATGWTPVPCQP